MSSQRNDIYPKETFEQMERRISRKSAISTFSIVPDDIIANQDRLKCNVCNFPSVILSCIYCKKFMCIKCRYNGTGYCIKCVTTDNNILDVITATELSKKKKCQCVIM